MGKNNPPAVLMGCATGIVIFNRAITRLKSLFHLKKFAKFDYFIRKVVFLPVDDSQNFLSMI